MDLNFIDNGSQNHFFGVVLGLELKALQGRSLILLPLSPLCHHRCVPLHMAYLLIWGLTNFLPGLASNCDCDPPNLPSPAVVITVMSHVPHPEVKVFSLALRALHDAVPCFLSDLISYYSFFHSALMFSLLDVPSVQESLTICAG
jgi:hypothetical protein